MTAPPQRDPPGSPPHSVRAASALLEAEVRARIAALEREARALDPDPRSARLFHEAGLLWEHPLGNLRAAAAAFQSAYRIAPRFVENLRSARRIFSDVGNWSMVLQLLDAELAATESPRDRAGLLFDKVQVLGDRLDRWDSAVEMLGGVLDLEPADLGLLVQAQGMLATRGDLKGLLRVQKLLVRALPDRRLAAHAHQISAGLHARLGDHESALAAWRQAFALDRSDPVTLGALRRAAEESGGEKELVEVLAAEAELGGSTSVAAYVALARTYLRLERPEDAVAALNAARHQNPGAVPVLSSLDTLLEALDRSEELAEVLAALADAVHDESEWLAVQLHLAALLEDTLHRDPQAVQCYQAVLARVPGHSAALAGLGRLHAKTQDWPALASVYDAELASVGETRARAELHFRSGEILDLRLGRTEEAVARFREALQLLPGYLPARQGLERILRREGRWAELISLHEEELLSLSDPLESVAALGRIAREAEEHLGDLEAASDALRRALELLPTHVPSLAALASLAERRGAWGELVQLLQRQAQLSAPRTGETLEETPAAGRSGPGDSTQAIAPRQRAAQILEERLGDVAGASAALEELLALEPRYVPALQALGRLYAREGRWGDLGGMYRREAALAGSARGAQLWAKVAELEESRLLDLPRARAAWEEVLERDPTNDAALRAVARMQRAEGDWSGLVETLRRTAEARTDARARANALFDVATVQLDALRDGAGARATLEAVLRLAPEHLQALRELERLSGPELSTERMETLERATQVGSTAERVAARLRLGHALLQADRLERAAAVAESALELAPEHLGALVLLEHARAPDRARRGEARERLAERVSDENLAAALRLAAELDQPRPRLEGRIEQLWPAFAADPQDARTAFQLERALRQAGDVDGLRDFYEQRLSSIRSPTSRLELELRLGVLAETAGDGVVALTAYQSALTLEPAELVALQGVRRLRVLQADAEAAALAWEAEAAATHGREGAIEAWIAAGRLWMEVLDQPERAIDAFERALGLDPLHVEASEAVESMLARKGGAVELASLNERRGQTRLAAGDRHGASLEYFKAAQGWLDGVGDAGRAMTALSHALEIEPGSPDALELKATAATEQGLWAEAVGALESRLRAGGDSETLAHLQLHLGVLLQDRLDQPERAVAAFTAALAAAPSAEALDRLASLHRASRNWTGAVDCLEQLQRMELSTGERARTSLRLAEALHQGFDDGERVLEEARRALPLVLEDPGTIERLIPLWERRDRLSTLLQLIEEMAVDPHPPAAVSRVWVQLSSLYLRTLGDRSRAVAACRMAVELDPNSVEAQAGLAEALEGDPGSVELAVEAHRAVLALDPTRISSVESLFEIWEAQGQLDRMFCSAAVLSFLQAVSPRAGNLHLDWRARVPMDADARVDASALDLLLHPDARNPLLELLRAVGDQVSKLYPPAFDALEVDRRADRLRGDHPIYRAVRLVAESFGVGDFEVYQARRGLMVAETSDPLSICVGQDVVRRFNSREQKFLIGRAVFVVRERTALLTKLGEAELADFLGDCVRVVVPEFDRLGTADGGRVRQLRKLFSRRAYRALEEPARALADGPIPPLNRTLHGLYASANRAGLLMSGDPAVALGMVLREDPGVASGAGGQDGVLQAVAQRSDLRALLAFSVSEELFELRARVGPRLPERNP